MQTGQPGVESSGDTDDADEGNTSTLREDDVDAEDSNFEGDSPSPVEVDRKSAETRVDRELGYQPRFADMKALSRKRKRLQMHKYA